MRLPSGQERVCTAGSPNSSGIRVLLGHFHLPSSASVHSSFRRTSLGISLSFHFSSSFFFSLSFSRTIFIFLFRPSYLADEDRRPPSSNGSNSSVIRKVDLYVEKKKEIRKKKSCSLAAFIPVCLYVQQWTCLWA